MDERLISQALQEIARKEVPDDMTLWPEVQAQLGRVSRRAVRSRVSWVVAAILALLALSAVAYAAARLLQGGGYDPGLQGASEADLVTILNQKQMIDGVTVTLDYAYADSNRISVSVSSAGNVPDGYAYQFGDIALSDDAGHVFQSMFGGGGGGGGGDGQSSTVTYTLSAVGSYDPSIIASESDKITLHLEVPFKQVLADAQSASAATPAVEKVIGPFVYDFTIPFIHGQVVEPQQAVTANGVTMTLRRLVIAPSLTRGLVCLTPASEPGYVAQMTLSVAGKAIPLGDLPSALLPAPSGSPPGCYDLQINQSLYRYSGSWTLTMSSLANYLPVGTSSGSNGTTYDFSIDGQPDALAQIRPRLEAALKPYNISVTEADGSLKFSYPVSAGIDENAINNIITTVIQQETPGPWVFSFDVPAAQ